MAGFHGTGKQVHVAIPEWLRRESDAKRQSAMLAYIFMWSLNGFANKDNLSLKEYFSLDKDDWTEEDTEYIIEKFIEHGYVIPENKLIIHFFSVFQL